MTMFATHNALWGNAMTQHHDQGPPNTALPPPRREIHDHMLMRTAAGIVTTALLLTSCTTPPATPPSSTTAPSATTTTATTTPAQTPTTAAPVYKPATDQGPAENVPIPVLPEQAKEFSKEGLIAFTEYWYSTLGYAFETGDAEPMMAISDSACRTCRAMSETVVAGHADGKWVSGGKMVLGNPNTSFVVTPENTYQVTVMARQEQVKYYQADKTLSKDLGVDIAELDILVANYLTDKWVATTVEHVAGNKAS